MWKVSRKNLEVMVSQVGRTLWRVQQALSWTGGEETPAPAPPLNEAEFHALLSPDGRLARPEDLRLRVYHGGVEPSLRKVPGHGGPPGLGVHAGAPWEVLEGYQFL